MARPAHAFSTFATSLFLACTTPHAARADGSMKVVTKDIFEEDRKGAYRHTTIEEFIDENHHLTERLYWITSPSHPDWLLGAKAWEDEENNVFMCLVFAYDDDGKLISETLYGNLSGTWTDPLVLDERGIPLNPDVESFTRLRLEDESNASTTIIVVDPETGEAVHPSHAKSSVWNSFTNALHSVAVTMKNFKHKLSYTEHMRDEWDAATHYSFNKGFLQLSGYYYHPAETGRTPYGEELNDTVRITMINGILNIKTDMEHLLKVFSETHGNVPIHYVFRPTEGWTKDLLLSTLSKMGYLSSYAIELADTWKRLINEMGGAGNGGRIVHYAHSIGATDTYVAKSLMTSQELEMIDVITLGSPSLIPNNVGFRSVVNYISKRDGVCLLDPIGYIHSWMSEESNAEFLGSFWGVPFIDHTLYTDTYGKIIKTLGEGFLAEVGSDS